MATIDDKVVAMSFESSKFESGVNKTISALDKLKASLKFPDAGKGLDEFAAASKRVDLSHIGRSVDAISQKLGYFSVAALAIFSNIALQAVRTGATIAKSLTLDPILAGYREYAVNLNSIQTILANTEASGATLKDVNAALLELNKYSDKTIYNFSQMARNIGTFTAAGVELEVATGAIKGIANLAALSGSSAEQASTAMYQLSQAISAGSVKLMDWNSVVNAGMGGTVFQRALAQTAEAMGTLKKGTVELTGPMKNVTIAGKSFRNSLAADGKDSWLTSKVLTQTLKQFTGDLKNAELAAMGFNAQQIKAIQQTAKTATFAATEVKTLTQVLDVAKETAGSGWAQTWQIIFGDFAEAKKTFTNLSEAINGFINANADARNKVLGDWKKLGGRTQLIEGIKIAFHNLGLVLKPIKEAFRDIFPAKTGKDLFALTMQFKDFARSLRPSVQTMANLKRTFAGIFAIFSIGRQIISGVFSVFRQLFSAIGGGDGGFLAFTATIGDFFVALDKALKKGDRLKEFFNDLANILAKPLEILNKIAGAIANLFSGFSPGGISGEMNSIGKAMTPLEAIIESIASAWSNFVNSIDEAVDMQSIITSISEAIQGLASAIGNAAANMNFEAILQVIRTGLFAGLVLMFKQFLGKGSFLDQVSKGFSGGILSNISGIFDGLNGSMKAVQQNIKAKTLKEIAIAIALLAASLFLISLIDPERLNSSLGAMAIVFAQLIGAMAILDKVANSGGFLKLPFIAASLVILAGAIGILTLSVLALSRLSWNDLLKGLAGVGGLLAGISAAVVPLSANSAGLIRAGIGLIGIAIAMRILASALSAMGALNWKELVKGLGAVAASLVIMATTARFMPSGLILMGVGLIAIATALKIIASVIADFGAMNWTMITKGLVGIGGALGAIALAMRLMPKSAALMGAGLLLVAFSLGKIADAVIKMGGMSITQIAKGLGTLAGSLVILAGALYLMSGTLAGSFALATAATGIALLAPALVLLGKQSWKTIIKGMIALAGALAILGVAGIALAGTIPALLGLGAALLLIGAGMALLGAGVFLIATGVSALLVALPTGVGILIAAFNELALAIPEMMTNLVLGLLEVINMLAEVAPKFVDGLVKIINSLLDVIIKSSPKFGEAFTALLITFLKVIDDNKGRVIKAGFDLIIALLQGIKDNISQIVVIVVDIVTTFLRTLANNAGRIVTAGANFLVSFLRGIANNIAKVVAAGFDIIVKFVAAIVGGYAKIVIAGVNLVVKLVKGISDNIGKIVKAGTDAVVSFVTAIGEAGVKIVKAGTTAAAKFVNAIATEIPKLAQDIFDAFIKLINGLAAVMNSEENLAKLRNAGKNLGFAMINGMTLGLAGKAQELYNKAAEIADKVLSILKKVPLINSPSKATMEIGASLVEGLSLGLDKNAQDAYDSAIAVSEGVIDAFNNTFQTSSPSKVMMEIGKFVGQGFAIGLRGSKDDINSAFTELNEKLSEAITKARETIVSEQAKIDELRKAKKPDTDAIKKAQAIIDQNEDLLRKSIATRRLLVNGLDNEHGALNKLSVKYDQLSVNLRDALDKLKALRDERESLLKSFEDKYSTTPTISTPMTEEIASARQAIAAEQAALDKARADKSTTPEQLASAEAALTQAKEALNSLVSGKVLDSSGNSVDILATYLQDLKNQTTAVNAYNTTLEQLRKLGIDEKTYQKLVEEGTADQAFADKLLAGGKTAVTGLNKLDTQLNKAAKTLATNSANYLKNAGIAAQEGLIQGLRQDRGKLRREMEEIAREMIRALKKELGIKSPSKLFEEIGKFAMAGLAAGFSKSSKEMTSAIISAADDAITAMKNSMVKISQLVGDELNPSLVLTPILDLSRIQSQSGELARLTSVSPITVATSYGQAAAISSEQNTIQLEELNKLAALSPSVKFEQNNYSPKALSDIEIYRQTKNQLSQVKSLLGTS